MEYQEDLEDQKAEDLETQPLTAGDASQAVEREKSSSSRDDSLREITTPRRISIPPPPPLQEKEKPQPSQPPSKGKGWQPLQRDTRTDLCRMRGLAISACASMVFLVVALLVDSLYIVEYTYPFDATTASGTIYWRISDFTMEESTPNSKVNAEVSMSYDSLYNAPEPRFDPKFQINAGLYLSISLILASVALFTVILSVVYVEYRSRKKTAEFDDEDEDDPDFVAETNRNEINVDWCTTFMVIIMCFYVICMVGGFVLYSVFEDADSARGTAYLRNTAQVLKAYHFPAMHPDSIKVSSGEMGLTQILGMVGFGIGLIFSFVAVLCAPRCPKKCRRYRFR